MSLRIRSAAAVVLVAFTIVGSVASAATVRLAASLPVVGAGAAFSLDVLVSDLVDGSAPSLGAYDFEVSFDPALVAFTSLEFGNAGAGSQLDLGGVGSVTSVLAGISGVVLSEVSLDDPALLDSLQLGEFSVARLFFTALASGEAVFGFSGSTLSDGVGLPLAASAVGTSVEIASPVPLPAAAWLLLSGLVLLKGASRGRRRSGDFAPS